MIYEFDREYLFLDMLTTCEFKDDDETYYSICNYLNRKKDDTALTFYEKLRQAIFFLYRQNEDMRKLLLKTGDEEILYLTHKYSTYEESGFNPDTKEGNNDYGRLLMTAREFFKDHQPKIGQLSVEDLHDLILENYSS